MLNSTVLGAATSGVVVYPLSPDSRPQVLEHLLRLSSEDRRLRFGVSVSDETIAGYVEKLDFSHDAVFGVRDDLRALVGFTHVAKLDDAVELGLSVDAPHRGRGIAQAMFRRALLHARNRGVRQLFMHCLAENAAMMHISREAGMCIVIDGSDRDASLSLPPATALSVGTEYYEGQLVLLDWALRAAVPRSPEATE
ncbi:MAG: GNAT family N-acetyltransferase [Burkholderiaceae bacterium]|nr:GNAT family N-acetyltransferase [Burkholderiaceae bacterium]